MGAGDLMCDRLRCDDVHCRAAGRYHGRRKIHVFRPVCDSGFKTSMGHRRVTRVAAAIARSCSRPRARTADRNEP